MNNLIKEEAVGTTFEFDTHIYQNPVLVSSTNGVGTKHKVAYMMDRQDTIGMDCVAVCANDILTKNAKPLYFMSHIMVSPLAQNKVADIVKGIDEACEQVGCVHLGSKQEMNDCYGKEEYTISGNMLGVANKFKMFDGMKMKSGDLLISIKSSGAHINGFSQICKIFNLHSANLSLYIDDLNKTLGEELLMPTRNYVNDVFEVEKKCSVIALAHVTCGGIAENLKKVLPSGYDAVLFKQKIDVLPIFKLIQGTGNLSDEEMFATFNMGVGMILVIPSCESDRALRILNRDEEQATIIGEIEKGNGTVKFK